MKLAKLILFATPMMMFAAGADYRLTLHEKSIVAGTELPPGDYKLQIDGDKVKFMSKKQNAEATVKMESGTAKYSTTSVRYANGDGKYKIQEIRLGGTTTKLVFN